MWLSTLQTLAGGVLTGENKAAILLLMALPLIQSPSHCPKSIQGLHTREVKWYRSTSPNDRRVTGRIMGSDRYDTAIKIAKPGTDRLLPSTDTLLPMPFRNAMSITENKNILLVRNDALPEATKSTWQHTANKDCFCGGTEPFLKSTRTSLRCS